MSALNVPSQTGRDIYRIRPSQGRQDSGGSFMSAGKRGLWSQAGFESWLFYSLPLGSKPLSASEPTSCHLQKRSDEIYLTGCCEGNEVMCVKSFKQGLVSTQVVSKSCDQRSRTGITTLTSGFSIQHPELFTFLSPHPNLLISALPVAQSQNLEAFCKNMFLNFIYFLTIPLGMQEGSQLPKHGSKPHPLQWKQGILTT